MKKSEFTKTLTKMLNDNSVQLFEEQVSLIVEAVEFLGMSPPRRMVKIKGKPLIEGQDTYPEATWEPEDQ